MSAILAGLATAVLYPNIVLLVPLFVASFFILPRPYDKFKVYNYVKYLLLSTCIAVVVFVLIAPYHVYSLPSTLAFISQDRFPEGVIWDTWIVYYKSNVRVYKNYLFWWIGIVPTLFIYFGFLLSIATLNKKALVMMSFAIAHTVVVGPSDTGRYAMPVFPVMDIIAAYAIMYFYGKLPSIGLNNLARVAITPLILGLFCLDTLPRDLRIIENFRNDTRTRAQKWIYNHIPLGSKILVKRCGLGYAVPLSRSYSLPLPNSVRANYPYFLNYAPNVDDDIKFWENKGLLIYSAELRTIANMPAEKLKEFDYVVYTHKYNGGLCWRGELREGRL